MEHHEEMVICPYEPSHQIRRGRLQVHLTKCEKQHPHSNLRECPYNQTHRIKPSEFIDHVETCDKSARLLMSTSYQFESVPQVQYVHQQSLIPPCDENWDNDVCPPVDVTTQALERGIPIPTPTNLSKAKKKLHKSEVRQRVYGCVATLSPEQQEMIPRSSNSDDWVEVPTRQSRQKQEAKFQMVESKKKRNATVKAPPPATDSKTIDKLAKRTSEMSLINGIASTESPAVLHKTIVEEEWTTVSNNGRKGKTTTTKEQQPISFNNKRCAANFGFPDDFNEDDSPCSKLSQPIIVEVEDKKESLAQVCPQPPTGTKSKKKKKQKFKPADFLNNVGNPNNDTGFMPG